MRNYLNARPGSFGQVFDPRVSYAQQLIQQGSDTSPVQHWGQGLGRLGQALIGAYLQKQAMGDRTAATKAFTEGGKPRLKEGYSIKAPGPVIAENPYGDIRTAPDADPFTRRMAQRDAEINKELYKPSPQKPMGLSEQVNMATPGLAPNTQAAEPITRGGTLSERLAQLAQMPDNPYAQEMIQKYGDMQMMRDFAMGDEQRQRKFKKEDMAATQGFQREMAGASQGFQKELADIQFERQKIMQDSTMTQQEKLAKLNNLNQLEVAKIGKGPYSPEKYDQLVGIAKAGKPDYSVTMGTPPPASETGIPVADSAPWEGMPGKDAMDMRADVYRDERKYIRGQRDEVNKQEDMIQQLKRFKYLNSIQETGGPLDRMTDFSFDTEKREMVRIMNKLTPQMRQGMPGAASDRDVAMFRGATVGIGNPKEVNDNITTGMLTMLENQADRINFMEDYLKQNKHLEGAEEAWSQYLKQNPIFDPEAPEGAYKLNTKRQEYRDFFKEGAKPQRKAGGTATDKPSSEGWGTVERVD